MSLWQTARFAVRTGQLDQIARWTPRSINRLQRWRLRSLVAKAVARSPFYREKYRGIDLSRLDLRRLPSTNKAEMMAQFDRVVTDPNLRQDELERFIADPDNLGRWYRGRYAVSQTSGSQGRPLLIVQERRCLEILFAAMSARANAGARASVFEGLRRLKNPSRVAVVSLRRGFYPSGAAFEFMEEIVGPFVELRRFSSMQPDLVERLNEFQPNALVAYAGVLEALALQADRLRLTELRQVSNSSEQLIPRARARIAAAFGVPISDHYGTGECLLLSDGCPTDGGAHVNADWAILEVVDDDNRPVPDGELGRKVLVTNLANHAQPFIRYEIGDQLAMATTSCRCGSRLPRIERIEGRSAELFWVRDWTGYRILSGAMFHTAVDSVGGAREWQAVQTERNHIELRLNLLSRSSFASVGLRQAILDRLREQGLPEAVTVDISVAAPLAADPQTGKLRRMVSQVGVPAELLTCPT